MKPELAKGLMIFGISGLLFWLLRPKDNKKATPAEKKVDKATLVKNATTALNSYLKAVRAGESAANLEELNKMIEDKYGVRVFLKQSEGKYYVSDLKGVYILKQ